MKFKLSPLWLFLLLLIVLIISAIFMNRGGSSPKESFISFYGTTEPNTTGLTMPNYENKVDKLYDNDFFDPKTGNILRVYAEAYNKDKGADTTGTSISHIDLIDRTGQTTKYGKGEKIQTNGLSTVPYNYTSWTAFSTNDIKTYLISNQLIYSCWGQDTYMHIIDFTNNLNACGFYYTPSTNGSSGSPIYTNFHMSLPHLKVTRSDTNPNNNTYVFNNIVNMPLYQFTSNVFYSPITGDVMMVDDKGKYLLYNRFGNSIPKFSNPGIESSTKPWVEYDLVGNHMMIYVPYVTNTMIIILKLNTDSSTFSIVTVGRFLEDGSLQKDANTNIAIPEDVLIIDSTTIPGSESNTVSSANFSTMSGNYNRMGGGTNTNYTMQQMNDYLLKTQVIPPICPVCPVCPSNTTCTNCGTTPSAPAPAPAAAPSSTPSSFYQDLKDAGKGVKDFAEDTGKGLKDFAEDTGKGVKDFAEDTASGAANLARETASGTVGLAKETVGGAVGLVKEAGKGTADILRGAGKEVAGLFKEEPYEKGRIGAVPAGAGGAGAAAGAAGGPVGYYAQGVSGPQNPFTYNGALTEKPTSDFIPITADFSKFGR